MRGAPLLLLLAAAPAWAEPCPMFGLSSQALQPKFTVSAEGGIVVAERPAQQTSDKAPVPDRSKWQARVKGKVAAAKEDAIAPGLVVYRPPANAASYELYDAANKRVGSATVSAKLPELLEAPRVRKVESGVSHAFHPTVFVSVELDANPPKTALALVLQKDKGRALSWGIPFPDFGTVTVYSNNSGCVSVFPDGMVQAQPGDLVTAFWVDATGRRSRVSTPVAVEKAP